MYKNINESGRSMIEMLGVLAIIGVLSVGGIAGYSKAMMMWRSNVQRNMLTELISGIIQLKSHYYNDKTESGEIDLTTTLGAMGLLPEETKYNGNWIQDKYGVRAQVARVPVCWQAKTGTNCGRVFVMRLWYVPTDGEGISPYQELCRNVVQVTKPMANEIGELRSCKTEENSENYNIIYYGWNLAEETVAQTAQKCKNVAMGVHMTIVFNF